MRALLAALLVLASGFALAQEPAGPAAASGGAAPPPAEGERPLETLREAVDAWEAEARDYHRDVQQLVKERVRRLEQRYERHLEELEALERKARLDAIAPAEEFLRRYPDDPLQTPEVMYRLAELHYERASDEHLLALREHTTRLQTPPGPGKTETPPEPRVEFSASIALYRKLLARFPSFREADGVRYLLAYCLEKQGQHVEGLAEYQRLIAQHPQSRFVTEAWVRIGEHFFDADPARVADALERAAEAYQQAARDARHPLHDEALYKLGWTYYRLDRFPEAVARFVALLDVYEAQARARGEQDVGGELREEALQYAALSLADERFAGAPAWPLALAELDGKPFGPELLRRTGDVLFELTRHEEAIALYRRVLQLTPLHPDAPRVQERIAPARARDRRQEEALAEGERLAATYAPGTPWRVHNRRNAMALGAADRLAEQALSGAALFHHQRAQAHRSAGREEDARHSYEVAARAYAAFLKRFPRSGRADEMRFYLAESLFQAQQFEAAARTYDEVRESPGAGRYRTEAAYAAVLAWQRHLEGEVKAGRASERKVLAAAERPKGSRPRPVALETPVRMLVDASDAFVRVGPQDARSAGVAYRAAELTFAHDDLPGARRRIETLMRSWPRAEVAGFATQLLAETYLVEEDWEGLEAATLRLAGDATIAAPDSARHGELVGLALSARFKRADQLLSQGRHEEAAQRYLTLVDEAPGHAFADEALNNAAVANESLGRFDTARRLFERLVRELPTSPLVEGALFRAAVDAEQSYDFDGAVESYRRLVRDFPSSRHREAALGNAAQVLEAQGRRDEAVETYLRAAELFPDGTDAPAHLLRAARLRERQEDWRGAIRLLEGFLARHSNQPSNVEQGVEAHRRIGDAWQRLGNARAAREAWTASARSFEQRGLTSETHPLAADAASAARFAVAEAELAEFERLAISGQGQALVRSLNAKKAALKRASDAYGEVFALKRLSWLLAAQYRRGFLLQRYAATLVETPVPEEVRRLGEAEVIAYQETVAAEAAQYEELAADAFRATLDVARKSSVSNAWTRRAREALHHLRPAESPLPAEPPVHLTTEELFPASPAVLSAPASVQLSQGNAEAAEAEARRALARSSRDIPALHVLARVSMRTGKDALARRVLEDARTLAPEDAATLYALGLVQLRQGEREAALQSFRGASAPTLRPNCTEPSPLPPNSPRPPTSPLPRGEGQGEGVVQPGCATPSTFAEAHNNAGALLLDAGDTPGALTALNAAVTAAPDLAPALLNLASALRASGDAAGALQHVQRARALRPDLADAELHLALLHLDGPVPGTDDVVRLRTALAALERYRSKGGKDERTEGWEKEARKALEREERRRERAQPEQPRPSAPTDPSGPSAAPSTPTSATLPP